MPIYEYSCEACGHAFEKLMRMSADAPPCPACESSQVRKLISASGFILKGSGWYKDHYGLKKSTTASGDDSAPKKADGGAKKESTAKGSGDSSGGKKADTAAA